ncbi:MAG: SDR family oxidoreductase [Alphaproteobacteria bacterium]|nr:SDR family oxidoreductase [Alphaproteobacteria bacterium]
MTDDPKTEGPGEDNPFRLRDDELASRPTIFASDLLDGQVVLVSGGASGIGRATAWLAARLGAKIVVAGRTEEKLKAVTEQLTVRGLKASYATANIRDREAVDTLFRGVMDTHGRLDLLINSAGGQFPQPAIDYSQGGWTAVIDTNLNGTFNMMQAAARMWRDAGTPGSIVNLVTVMRGLHGVAHSLAARAGVIAFSECVSVEWAPLKIRINCVAPGSVKTEGWRVYPEEALLTYPTNNPTMRVGDPWEIAQACLYIGGPAAGYITGETLTIDGGGQHWGEIWTTGKPDFFASRGG